MSVGFVVVVSTILLRRLERKGILMSWFDQVFEYVCGSEVVGVGVCLFVFVFLFDARR